MPTPRACRRLQLDEDVGTEPRLAGRALALEGERPVADSAALGDERRGLQELVAVGIALGEDPLREAVRGEDDVRVGAAHAVGQELDVRLVVVPALHEGELGAAVERILEPVAVAADRDARVVRGEHEPDEPLGAVRERPLDRLRDPGLPVLHAHVDGRPVASSSAGALRLRDPVQGRVPPMRR